MQTHLSQLLQVPESSIQMFLHVGAVRHYNYWPKADATCASVIWQQLAAAQLDYVYSFPKVINLRSGSVIADQSIIGT